MARLGSKVFLSKLRGHPWPLSVSFHVTRHCNLRCKHCYAMLETSDKPDPTLEQLCGIIEGLARRGTVLIRMLGGEPLVRNDLPKLIECVKANGMICEITTNGTLLRERIAEWPQMRKLDSVCVSLDGNQPVHDQLRGEGSFARTVDGIHALMEAGLPVRIHASLAADSYRGGHEPHKFLADFAAKHDIPFNVATYVPNPNKSFSGDRENRESFKMSTRVYKDLIAFKEEGVPVSTSKHVLELAVSWFDHTDSYRLFGDENVIPPGCVKCQGGRTNCFIDFDGGMYNCIVNWKKGLNVYEAGLDEAYRHMVAYRKKVGCQICYNVCQWEYTRLLSLSDPRLFFSMTKNVWKMIAGRRESRKTRSVNASQEPLTDD